MPKTRARSRPARNTPASSRWRTALLVAAGLRTVLGLIAIPLAPALYEDHFVVLVLLRPTKEVLLAGGFLIRQREVGLVPVVLAAVPLMVFGVWLLYFLGRSWSSEICSGKGLPSWAKRIMPTEQIVALGKVLDRRGRGLIILGRLAAFPSALLGAAAGASGMEPRRFLPADGLGAVLSLVEVLVAGWLFGAAYKEAGPWLTGLGVLALFGLLSVVGRLLRREVDAAKS